ncbi:MAG: SLOG family protein [Candidatus Coproplasma sp.]
MNKPEIDKMKCCAFTGHRNVRGDLDLNALTAVIRSLIERGVTTFLNGMARGFDLISAQCVLNLKKQFPFIRLIACVPCPNQEKYFNAEDKRIYKQVIERCDRVDLISPDYFKTCMLVRNRYMVDNSSYLIAYDRGEDGGTKYTLDYAKNKKMEIYII